QEQHEEVSSGSASSRCWWPSGPQPWSEPTLSSRRRESPHRRSQICRSVSAFRFACRATGNSELGTPHDLPADRTHAPGDIVSDACFENCGKPLWQPAWPCTTAQQTCRNSAMLDAFELWKAGGIDLVLILAANRSGVVLLSGFFIYPLPETPKRPLHQCCTKMLCINMDNSGGRQQSQNGAGKLQPTAEATKQQQRLVKAPAIQPFSQRIWTTASGQVYSEPTWTRATTAKAEASDGRDADYRLQTHFDAADSRVYPMVSGSPARVLVVAGGGSFFNRDAPDRHSFHNVRASRQRPAIPVDLLMRGNGAESGGGGGAQWRSSAARSTIYAPAAARLSAAAQPFASSQQELHRSAERNENAHRGIRSDNTGTMLRWESTRWKRRVNTSFSPGASSAKPPTVQASSERPPPAGHRAAIKEEEVDEEPYVTESQESVQYPTVKTAQKRRSSHRRGVRVWEAVPDAELGNQR
uniref:Protein kinase domain-containing protein n=1 Tax=Macrostomum lignano TaxID=282301 RepID=A0A1I8FCR8_9PLAT